MKVILASASPRRQELLKEIFTEFEIMPADVDETLSDKIKAEEAAEYLSRKKAGYIAENNRGALVIGSDTTVVTDGVILGKPADKADARRMLNMLSGKTHKVITGVSLYYKEKAFSFSEVSKVKFFKLSDKEIEAYLETDEWSDKAGAYGIQGKAGLFVEKINGDYNNVVGLPVARLNRVLKEFI
ncbi:MAG: septum formation protein Maf [Ruminococcus sp.]|nr:septum formation protein Maf [Ruminococcus sp.]